jgi:hypothetical protein
MVLNFDGVFVTKSSAYGGDSKTNCIALFVVQKF